MGDAERIGMGIITGGVSEIYYSNQEAKQAKKRAAGRDEALQAQKDKAAKLALEQQKTTQTSGGQIGQQLQEGQFVSPINNNIFGN